MLTQKKMVIFSSSTIPKDINIQFFYDKILAFSEVGEYGDYKYFYFGEPTGAKDFLRGIGFQDVQILAIDLDRDGFFLVKRTAQD